ncbi:MerR family transcriptional regulator [Rhodococcus sp. SGAir0479]|uniref:MerR family transcriptional regulator n=1 Tax=Rhodococcus sp. SGAir0479 TaxID=2567884 RepID=UPI0020C7F364|nr:MerR family transcriptional regulator [Rhodococcus sp. SGAir0479]
MRLRFYADAGLLLPAKIDPVSGYRFYGDGQLELAVLLRGLREIGMPLAAVKSVLGARHEEAVRLLDEHVNAVVSDAAATLLRAVVITSRRDWPRMSLIRGGQRRVVASGHPRHPTVPRHGSVAMGRRRARLPQSDVVETLAAELH